MAQVRCSRCQFLNPEGQTTCAKCQADLPKVEIQVKNSQAPEAPRQELQFRQHQLVAGRYTVQNIIGRGGMGCIYKVHDNTLNEEVALKTLLPQFARDKIVVERFFNEARIARQLSHQNIVRVHDIGTTDGVIYISMEYLRGKSLRAYMENLMPGQRLPLKSVLRVFDELCGALEYAHRYTIHRDIKPENVMITQEGQVKLMDFGISKLMANTQLTQASMVMGTPFYMSPEQLRNSASVDARADVYSVGVMLYEVLTGNVPVGMAKPVSEIRPDIPPALDPIVRTCIETDPENRFQNASELRQAIREVRVIVDPEFDPEAASKIYRGTSSLSQNSRVVGWGLVAALAILMAVGLWQAETQRRDLVATAAAATPAVTGSAPAPVGSMDQYESLIDRVRSRVEAMAADDSAIATVLQKGDRLWKEAETSSDTTKAWHALQCFTGPLIAPAGMIFIPPGSIAITDEPTAMDGFFIDETEVTVDMYRSFCASQNWPAPGRDPNAYPVSESGDPVVLVTFYDALAYAASQENDLPTEAQWARAAYGAPDASSTYPWGDSWEEPTEPDDETPLGPANFAVYDDGFDDLAPVGTFETDRTGYGCYDMAGNVREWTRTALDGTSEPGFGVTMIIRGDSYLGDGAYLNERGTALFESRSADLGFRCVHAFPTDLNELEKLLENAAIAP